jgi:proteasome lid subunit RPN8/RPN11
MLLRFQKAAGRGNYETGNQAFSKCLRFLTIRDGNCVLDQVVEFEHVRRTFVAVEGKPESTHRVLMKLEQFKHRLLGHFHSHPGDGLGLTLPSGTDRAYQGRLEQGGYPVVAAIFSRDGYVRFFRLDNNVSVNVHGEGVEEIEPNIFRITDIDQIDR